MRIVISGYYGFDNVGDDAILLAIIQELQRLDTNVLITALSNDPESTKQDYGIDAVNRWKLTEVKNAINESDGLISGGGSLLQDKTGWKSIPYYLGIIKIAKWFKKPVVIYAQGMGPINHVLSKWLVKRSLSNVNFISVRDQESKVLLKQIGIRNEVDIVPDPVLGLNTKPFTNTWLKKQGLTEDFVAVSVREWPTDIDYASKIANGLDQLAKEGNRVVFVSMHGYHDEEYSNQIASLMSSESYVVPGSCSIEEKVSIIGNAKLLIGMRLHALIFAAINDVPFIALSYDPKIDAFASIMDQPVLGHVTEDTWDSNTLTSSVNVCLASLNIQKEKLIKNVSIHRSKAEITAEKALKTFKDDSR